MKKVYAFLMMAAALVACTREEQPRTETPDQPESPATYTLTIQASKGQDTRALVLDGNTLNATWGGSEQVLVYLNGNPDQLIATLTPDLTGHTDPASCLLVGEFTQLPGMGDVLTLKLNSNNYSDQRGTLAYIADNCDYAVATLQVTGVDNGQILSREGGAEFESQQAIVKFTLQDNASGAAISPSALTVKGDGTEVATVTGIDANSGGVLFVAIPAISGTIDLAATVGSDTYKYSRENVTFTAGKYYSITVKMAMTSNTFNLNDESLYVNGLFTAQDGAVLTGRFPDDGYSRRIRIANGATVTLHDATIVNSSTRYAAIALDGNATIILVGENTVSGNSHHAGISVSDTESTLTILGDGKLTAMGGYGAAGIGCGSTNSGDEASCGTIIISGGTIEATGGNGAAGIGGGMVQTGAEASCGAITISAPAQVTATKGFGAPYSIGPSAGGSCGTVTIYDHVYWDESAGIQDATLSTSPLVIPFSQN